MKKLREKRGMTLIEMLCAVLLLLIMSGMLTLGVSFAVRTYRDSMQSSQAQELCSTITAAISDKLRYCGSVSKNGDSIFIQDVGSVSSGEGEIFSLNESGEITLDAAGTKKLLGSRSYPRGLRVEELRMTYDSDSGIFSVSFRITDGRDRELAGSDFDVKRINLSDT